MRTRTVFGAVLSPPDTRHPRRLSRLVLRGGSGLELAAQPVDVGQDLAAQRPAVRAFGRVRAKQVGQPVLLALGLGQVILECGSQRLGPGIRRRRGVDRFRVGLDELAVGAHRAGQFGDDGGEPGPGLRVPDRAVVAVQPRAVGHRASQHAQVGRGPLQRVHAVAQARSRVGDA